MSIFFTADTHFGHTNIVNYCQRPFSDAQEMDEEFIRRWNRRVRPSDTVYHLGDFAVRSDPNKYIDRLNGKIILIRGNHDHNSNMRNGHFYAVYDMFTVKTVQPNIILCHYAMRSWDRSHYGTWHLHGHHHGKMTPYRNTLDVGVDCNCYKPVSLDEIRHEMEFYWSDPSERRSRGTKK